MFYKLMNGDIVTDLLTRVCYVRYLPKSQRWVTTEGQSAHGVTSSDGSEIYLLAGKSCAYPDELTVVTMVEIGQEEYERLAETFAVQNKQNESLREEIDGLKAQLEEQNSLLQMILEKL